ncbi:NACHT, LRR and PYD domains-containing protein 1b allele 2-like [Enoplosus armatus]|uniref:NACHT, LRR and PYD domains-containing protein 1b allele 2-like n=1 Tax=Enoplosus armatus TaxID=215367 RepID=UPI0039915CF6
MEKIEEYMPAGPLMDISMIAGKFSEVYLPHWICIDDNPKILDKFAVLHIDDYGDVVEKVAEVTPSHVKLSEPAFSPRAVLMKVGFPVKIRCKVLIYKTNTAFLTLHVYLIPCDPGLRQEMDKQELSYGYNIIRKPHPERSLKMQDCFILTADLDGAEINPQKLKLRYESKDPNFFEVFIENPDRNFTLKLAQENEHEQVWTCVIRKDECQSTGHIQGQHFVDKHRHDLIERVSNIEPILDNLLRDGVIQQEDYDTIAAIRTTQDKVRKLFIGPLRAGGHACKDLFYKILEEKEPFLVTDLKRKES